MKKYFKNKTFLTGFCMVAVIFVLMIIGFFWTPYDFAQTDASGKFADFSASHLLGTDNLGRDTFSRILVAIRVSVFIGFVVMITGLFFGLIFGSISGWFGGWIDTVVMKIINTKMSFPGILLALMLIAVFGTEIEITLIALSLMAIPRFTRIIRSGYIKYRNSLFVLSARAKGASSFRIMYLHILPNIIADILVTSTLSFGLAILSESGLSYLGLGVQPPLPSFGKMLNDGQRFILQNPAGVLVPGFFLCILLLGLNLIGDGITEVNS